MTPDRSDEVVARVLTVDDEAVFRAAARELVDATPGFTTVADATSGAEGLALALELQPDLVLVDINLPDLSGFDVCQRLRRLQPTPTVVMVSSDDDAQYHVEAQRCGAVAFIPKNRLTPGSLQRLWQDRQKPADSGGTR